jgi:hypothetical protein
MDGPIAGMPAYLSTIITTALPTRCSVIYKGQAKLQFGGGNEIFLYYE